MRLSGFRAHRTNRCCDVPSVAVAPYVLLAFGLMFSCVLSAQDRPVTEATAEAPQRLHIVIVEGDGAINNLRQRVAREPIVQVEDSNRRPVAGAAVTFTLPGSGASGTFSTGSKFLTIVTDDQGRAVASGLKSNNTAGTFQIRVSASYQGMTGSTTISQTNVAGAVAAGAAGAGISAKLIAVIAVVGAAAVGGAVVAARGGDSSGGRPTSAGNAVQPVTIGISPGSPSVGPPR